MSPLESQSTPEPPVLSGAVVEAGMSAYLAKKIELRADGDGPLERGSQEAMAVLAALGAAVPLIKGEAWLEGHESGFWNGRESAGNGEMSLVGVEHALANNPYGCAAAADAGQQG